MNKKELIIHILNIIKDANEDFEGPGPQHEEPWVHFSALGHIEDLCVDEYDIEEFSVEEQE